MNYFGYKPLGSWNGEGPGDTELGLIYRLTDWEKSGLAMTVGAVLPTGRQDDPDILQDFSFGDGQTDAFLEFGGGFSLFDDASLSFDSSARITYQFAANKTLRIPENEDYQLGSEKALFNEKLGNKLLYNLSATYAFTDWFSLSTKYEYEGVGQSEYTSAYSNANKILEKNTEKESHAATGSINFTTVKLYQRGDFVLPFNASLSATNYISAKNMPKYNIYMFKMRFYF